MKTQVIHTTCKSFLHLKISKFIIKNQFFLSGYLYILIDDRLLKTILIFYIGIVGLLPHFGKHPNWKSPLKKIELEIIQFAIGEHPNAPLKKIRKRKKAQSSSLSAISTSWVSKSMWISYRNRIWIGGGESNQFQFPILKGSDLR